MTLLGFGINGFGWMLVVWGIYRKTGTQEKIASLRDSLGAVATRLRARLGKGTRRLADAFRLLGDRVRNAGQAMRAYRSKKPRHIHISPGMVSNLATAFDPIVARGHPSVEGNQSRIELLERRLRSSDDESLFADGLVAIGGFLSVVGTVVLAIA